MIRCKRKEQTLIIPCRSVSADSTLSVQPMARAAAQTESVSTSPTVSASGCRTFGYIGGVMTEGSADSCLHTVSGEGDGRMYMTFGLPPLPGNPRIVRAELRLTQGGFTSEDGSARSRIGLYAVTSEITEGECTPASEEYPLDYVKLRAPGTDGQSVVYSFDITALADRSYSGEQSTAALMLKVLSEDTELCEIAEIYGAHSEADCPQLCITYEPSYGRETGYRAHSHDLGRFGRASIDLGSGTLSVECDDFIFSGSRMPVSIRHYYSSALDGCEFTASESLPTADFTGMHVGIGFKLNIMQSMCAVAELPYDFEDGIAQSGYAYAAEDGRTLYFAKSTDTEHTEDGTEYSLYEDVEGEGAVYDPHLRALRRGSETLSFDSFGRLVSVSDGNGNSMCITYTKNRITSVSDGAGRVFGFGYSTDGCLTSITAPDGGEIRYHYTDGRLSSITYPDTRKAAVGYTDGGISAVILYGTDASIQYRVLYSYVNGRVYRVSEYGVSDGAYIQGAVTTYAYSAAANRTTVTVTEEADTDEGEVEPDVIRTYYTFDDEGNIVSEYSCSVDTGNVGGVGTGGGINPIPDNSGYSAPVVNLLRDHSFERYGEEDASSAWVPLPDSDSGLSITRLTSNRDAKHGRCALRMVSVNSGSAGGGVSQNAGTLTAGEYTYSAYIRPVAAAAGEGAGVYLRVTDAEGNILSESERMSGKEAEYVRVCTSFTLTQDKAVSVQILADGKCGAYIDSAQLERSGYASEYNMLPNSSFVSDVSGWTGEGEYSQGVHFDSTGSLLIRGGLSEEKKVWCDIPVKAYADTLETFTLSGWARAVSIPLREREGLADSGFCLFAEVHYTDGSADAPQRISYCPAVTDWQYVSAGIEKASYKSADFIRVGCEYSYNTGNAYFDALSLVRTGIEFGVDASVIGTPDADTYAEQSGYETEHSEIEAEDGVPSFEEVRDQYGNNLTETTYADGEFGTVYRAFSYSENGNDLVRETDARGNTTEYTVDTASSRNTSITDRESNRTEYEYDANGRTARVRSIAAMRDANGSLVRDAEGNVMYETEPTAQVSYSYDAFDNMTEIARGDGMKYVLSYNAYHNLASIGIDGKSNGALVTYTYKQGNGRLKKVEYANGDKMHASYNSIGQMTAERWYDANEILTAYYKYTYDAQGNIVRSIDLTGEKEYTYMYENGMLTRSAEYDITVELDFDENPTGTVLSRTLAASVLYSYDSEGTLTRKRVKHTDGTESVIYSESDDGNTVVKFTAGGMTVTSHSKTDGFGRKVFDELQLGRGFVSRQFDYCKGEASDGHKDNGKLKSTPTTQLVSRITFADGRNIEYEYDGEERITRVTDSLEGTTEYTYDSLGQLKTETKNGVTVGFAYNNYGNITEKGICGADGEIVEETKITYTYGNDAWKDLLTAYNGQTITYDEQGNPLSYLGHTLTWEKGRQLNSFDADTYTYNANGIRTSKTIGGVKHTYTLDGAKILREAWTVDNVTHSIIPLYDNEDAVCGILYNNIPYYFIKNLQGDVIAITDANAEVVARYTYDAWGVCTALNPDGTAIPAATHIANLNPYRYRSYYYDTETGLYYLQSRYYNPVVGRFINGDKSYILFVQGCLSLFTYCYNDAINFVDLDGEDAIWLQDSDVVYSFGHTGLLIQDSAGCWWHFYWGNNRSGKKGKKGEGKILLSYTGGTDLDSINKFYYDNYGNKYEKSIYFSGDFSDSVEYARKLNSKNYLLIGNNCVQVSIDVLDRGCFSKSNFEFKAFLARLRLNPIPNVAFVRMNRFNQTVNKWHSTPWYLKWMLTAPFTAAIFY